MFKLLVAYTNTIYSNLYLLKFNLYKLNNLRLSIKKIIFLFINNLKSKNIVKLDYLKVGCHQRTVLGSLIVCCFLFLVCY